MLRLEYINIQTADKWEHIGNFENEKLMWEEINEFFLKCNYKSYYQRCWKIEGGWTMIDFGSHTQFYRFKSYV